MIHARTIRPLRGKGPDIVETNRLKSHFQNVRPARIPFFLKPAEFDDVLRWKLRGQYGRQRHRREAITPEMLTVVTRAAFEVSCACNEMEAKVRVGILSALPGVGVPVASAILTLVQPEEYGVIDFRAWRQIFPGQKLDDSVSGYGRYMREIWRLADELGWSAQEVDQAIWEYDRLHDKAGDVSKR
jgi:hypothetical protein